MKINRKLGFTLAEILITLTIIGIVAALTIPTLIQNVKNDAIVAQVKKSYSLLSQAYASFIADGTTMDTVFAGNYQHAAALNRFKVKFNVVKNCGTAAGCMPNIKYKILNGVDGLNYNTKVTFAKAILSDGTLMFIHDRDEGCVEDWVNNPAGPPSPFDNVCAEIGIDVNGSNGPNQEGRDTFWFYVTRTGVFTSGSDYYGANDCVITDSGSSCATRILTENAINY